MLTPLPDWIEGLAGIAMLIGIIAAFASSAGKDGDAVKEAKQEQAATRAEQKAEARTEEAVDKHIKNAEKQEQQKNEQKTKLQKLEEEARKANEELKKIQASRDDKDTKEQKIQALAKETEKRAEEILKKGGNEKTVNRLKELEQELIDTFTAFEEASGDEKKKLGKEIKQLEKEAKKLVKELVGEEMENLIGTYIDDEITAEKKIEKKKRTAEHEEEEIKKAAETLERLEEQEAKTTAETEQIVQEEAQTAKQEEEREHDAAARLLLQIERKQQQLDRETDKKKRKQLVKDLELLQGLLAEESKHLKGDQERLRTLLAEVHTLKEAHKSLTEEEIKTKDLVDQLKDLERKQDVYSAERLVSYLYYVVREAIGTPYHIDAKLNAFKQLHKHISKLDSAQKDYYEEVQHLIKTWEKKHRAKDEEGNDIIRPEYRKNS